MHELTELLKGATANIEPPYFQIAIDGGDPVYRERVYCYELYHQLRCMWPPGSSFYLNGELDKAAHPILRKMNADYAKPDLLVHRPGHMEGNNTIIEVKSANAKTTGIGKDLDTLDLFRSKVGYQRAIYLIFGNEAFQVAARARKVWSGKQNLATMELWIHDEAGKAARRIGLEIDECPACNIPSRGTCR